MAKKLDQKEIVSFEEVLKSNVMEQEALINLLEKKGIITKSELIEEIKRLKGGKGGISGRRAVPGRAYHSGCGYAAMCLSGSH